MSDGTHNEFGGHAATVLQFGVNNGVVNVHGATPLAPPRQVPPPTPHFTNQETERTAIRAVLAAADGVAIVALRGAPGTGRRALARQLAHDIGADYPHAHFYADLAAGPGVQSERLRDFLLSVDIAATVIPDSLAGRVALFRTWTTNRRVLVVVENALGAAAVRALTPGAGRSAVLVTASGSLAGLGTDGATTFVDLEPLIEPAARRLLTKLVGADRAAAEPAEFDRLLAFCGGYPIALCVAGMTLVSTGRRIARLVRDLADTRTRLRALSRAADLSVTAVFAETSARLGEDARTCYHAIGRHPHTGELGSAVLAAATDLPVDRVLDAMDELVDVRLIQEVDDDRYAVHELIWLHASDITEQSGMDERVLAYYRHGALAAGRAIAPNRPWLDRLFPDSVPVSVDAVSVSAAWEWLDRERANLRAIVARAYDVGEYRTVGELAVALWPFHDQGKHLDDERVVNELAMLAARRLGRPDLESLAGTQLGFAHQHAGDTDKAYRTFAAARTIAAAADLLEIGATAVEAMGLARIAQHRLLEARELLRVNLALAARIGDPRRLSLARFHLAKVESATEALALLDEVVFTGEPYNLAKLSTWRGRKLIEAGRLDVAETELTAALAALTAMTRPFDQAVALEAFAELATARGDLATAADRYREALAWYRLLAFTAQAERIEALLADL